MEGLQLWVGYRSRYTGFFRVLGPLHEFDRGVKIDNVSNRYILTRLNYGKMERLLNADHLSLGIRLKEIPSGFLTYGQYGRDIIRGGTKGFSKEMKRNIDMIKHLI